MEPVPIRAGHLPVDLMVSPLFLGVPGPISTDLASGILQPSHIQISLILEF